MADELYHRIPAGVGVGGFIKLTPSQLDEVLVDGAGWAIKRGFGIREDLSFVEENGQMKGAIPDNVSELAKNANAMKWALWVRGIIIWKCRWLIKFMTKKRHRRMD